MAPAMLSVVLLSWLSVISRETRAAAARL